MRKRQGKIAVDSSCQTAQNGTKLHSVPLPSRPKSGKVPALLGVGCSVVIFLSVAGGCSEGQVRLVGNGTGGLATGGLSQDVGDSTTGGQMMPSGTSGPDPGYPENPTLEEPCFVRDECRPHCPPDGEPDCGQCQTPGDCNERFPWCDLSVGHCVECINRNDCLFRFGPLYGACSNGRCVQCQVDFDCDSGQKCDRGWCGSCDHEDECPFDSECHFGRCIPH